MLVQKENEVEVLSASEVASCSKIAKAVHVAWSSGLKRDEFINKASDDHYLETLNKQSIGLLIRILKQLSNFIPLRIRNISEVVEGLEERDFKNKKYQLYIKSLKQNLKTYRDQFNFIKPRLVERIEYLEQILTFNF